MVCVSVTSKGEKVFLNVKKNNISYEIGNESFPPVFNTRNNIHEKTNRVKRQYSYIDYFYTFVDFLL